MDTGRKRREILRWLSEGDFEETHDRHYKKRCKDTGQWLLEDPRLISWRDGTQSSLLWCHGARKFTFPCFMRTAVDLNCYSGLG